jgi:hypothetical protein
MVRPRKIEPSPDAIIARGSALGAADDLQISSSQDKLPVNLQARGLVHPIAREHPLSQGASTTTPTLLRPPFHIQLHPTSPEPVATILQLHPRTESASSALENKHQQEQKQQADGSAPFPSVLAGPGITSFLPATGAGAASGPSSVLNSALAKTAEKLRERVQHLENEAMRREQDIAMLQTKVCMRVCVCVLGGRTVSFDRHMIKVP